jgi:hypothetical protein
MMRYSPMLLVHISAGMVGMVSGAAAMILRKGGPRHALAGQVFVASMLTMAATATYLAVIKHQDDNVGGGILTFYLVLTAWLTARRQDGETSIYDWAALLIPLALGVATWMNGVRMLQAGSKEGTLRVGMAFFMGSMLLLAAAGDLRMLLRGGLFGSQRVVRHLWRMCLGWFIATGSFFLGQASKAFPSVFRQSGWLFLPAFFPLLLLIFWLFRVRFANAYKMYRERSLARVSAASLQS